LYSARIRNWLLATCFAAFCGCTISKHGNNLEASDPDYPEANASASQRVFIRGLVPPTFDLALDAIYSADYWSGRCNFYPDTGAALNGASFPKSVRLPLKLDRESDTYKTEAVVDRYLPGYCGWRFSGVVAKLSKRELRSISNLVVSPLRDSYPYESLRPKESWASNSQPTAVVLRCDFRRVVSLKGKGEANACALNDDLAHKLKRVHLLRSSDTFVEVRFVDVENHSND